MAVSVHDMQAAMGELRNEFQRELQTIRDSTIRFQDETRQQFLTEKEAVSTTVTERLESAGSGFRDEQTRVNSLLERIQGELETMKTEVQAALQKVEAVSDGKLNEVATTLIEQQALMAKYSADNVTKVDTIYEILKIEVNKMHSEFRDRLGEVRQ